MKKALAMILTLSLICVSTLAGAVSYTLPEKLSRQLQIGSGLKGSFVLNAEGNGEIAAALAAFNRAEIQVRGMASDQDWHYYFYQTDEAENQWGRTDLQKKDGAVYLKSELIDGEKILMFPAMNTALDMLTQGDGKNPSFASAIWNLARMSDKTREEVWMPLVNQLEDRIETWLTPYALDPVMHQNEAGQTVIDLSYVIPMEAMKKGILDGLELIVGNPELMALTDDLITEEQKEVYLNPYLRYFYEAALDQLTLPFDVSLNRTVSTMGNTLSSVIELPLDEEKTGFSALILATEGKTQKITLGRTDREVTVIWPEGSLKEDGQFSLWVIDRRSEESSTVQRIDLTRKQESWEDEDTRSHEQYLYTIDIQNDFSVLTDDEQALNFSETPDRHGKATLHFYSKYAQSSPTTLEVSAEWQEENLGLTLTGKIKSASPWVYSPFEIMNPQNVLEMKTEEWAAIGAELLAGARKQIIPNAPEETPQPTETPAPTAWATMNPEQITETEETAAPMTEAENVEEIPEDEGNYQSQPEEDTSDWPELTASPESDG